MHNEIVLAKEEIINGIEEHDAAHANKEEVKKMQMCPNCDRVYDESGYLCSTMDELIRSNKPHLKMDQEFHTCIARCGGNIIMPKILPIIHGAIGVFIESTGGSLKEETIRTHWAILNAIRRHDPTAASDAMYLHLIYNRDRLNSDSILRGGQYGK